MTARLDRYVTMNVLGAYAAALGFLVAMFVVFDLLFEMNRYVATAGRTGTSVIGLIGALFEYHVLGLPFVFVTIAPFVTVIASMFALSRLMATNEVAPMIFTGRSMFQVLRPMLGVATLSALAMGCTWQWIIPSVNDRYEQLHADLRGDDFSLKKITIRSKTDPRLELFCREYHHEPRRMEGVILFHRGSSRGDGIYVEAKSAVWNAEAEDWQLTGGKRMTRVGVNLETVEQDYLGMDGLTPNLLVDLGKVRKQRPGLSYTELLDLIELRPGNASYQLEFHVHFTFPLANIVLLLLALPFAVNFERGRRIERVVFAIVICAGYLVMDLTCRNLVYEDFVHPIVAAWTPTIVFGSLGVVVFGSMRT